MNCTGEPVTTVDDGAWLALAQRLGNGGRRTTQQVLDDICATGVCDLVAVVVPDGPDTVRIPAAAGETAPDWRGRTGPADGLRIAAVLRDGRSRLIADATERLDSNVRPLLRVRSAVFAALTDADGEVWGVLTLGRYPTSPRYGETDLALGTMLARLVPPPASETRPEEFPPGIADAEPDAPQLDEAVARSDERDRIARALNTEAIGQMFALGMRLQSAAGEAPEPLRQMLAASSDDIDDAVKSIRGAVYGLAD